MLSSPFRALQHYRLLPSIIPLPRLIIAAGARVPYSMIPLGTVAAVSQSTGSIALGGMATAAIALSSTIAAPLLGRLSDIIGTPRLLAIFSPLSAASLAFLLTATVQAYDDWKLSLAAALTGATMIPVGALTRARWVSLRPDPRTLATAFSYETMVDELMFVIGPIFVGLTGILAYWMPLALALFFVCFAVGAFTFESFSSATTTLPHLSSGRTSDRSKHGGAEAQAGARPPILVILWRVAPLIGVMIAMGLIFGTVQTGITERAIAAGTPQQAGLWYGLMGIGSAIVSIFIILIPEKISAATRIFVASALLIITTHSASHIDSLASTGALLFALGFGMGSNLVTSFATAEKLAPPGGIAVAMTAMPAAITIGVSAGSVIGGQAAVYGSHVAFHAATTAAMCAIICALWLRTAFRRTHSATNP